MTIDVIGCLRWRALRSGWYLIVLVAPKLFYFILRISSFFEIAISAGIIAGATVVDGGVCRDAGIYKDRRVVSLLTSRAHSGVFTDTLRRDRCWTLPSTSSFT
ncbi:uncharacterized protein EV420DRAFT_354771 [Desarmillaria tabescens]|uniref:Uncharacterized protein n=1 Tax=Armillaria tabescens TaxID=1929756 RepID=A0AA39KEH0_ARMTA|nr:uncharacterized protein EV420DRAFT_354771 [Desarmillaria tabescens]KAK0458411.1 hypothetical protein EV420DRAFT_354771 [Desarmillaria tabescens]